MSKDNISFEKALSELEKISGQLQGEDVSLDDAIALFEKGIKLSKECSDKLETAKQKIEKLTVDGSDNND
ncbi:MAG: exodeoxyribonuclease VII small subunit [Clostridia bacterium]|nr:exodeoxyribonuclease VII small subunit [Clostridia bacterium]